MIPFDEGQGSCGGAAAAGLVSLFNKSEMKFADSPEEAHAARLRKMAKGVFHTAKILNNALIADGYTMAPSPKVRRIKPDQYRAALVTLTYRPEVEWSPAHIAALLDHYRKWAKRKKARFAYVWTMELHASGVPHYHIVFWLTGGEKPPFPDAQGWWPHGSTRAEWAFSPVGYIAKYASKGTSGKLPKGARVWGSGGLPKEGRAERSWALAPRWVRKVTRFGSDVKRKAVEITEQAKYGLTRVVKVVAWVNELGWALFGPWERDGFAPGKGVVLSHRGYVEAFSPCGEYFQIPMTA